MRAHRADLGRSLAHHDVAAVAALPHLHLAFGEDFLGLDIAQEGTVTLFVALFDGCYHTELGGQGLEAFFLGGLGEAFVHIRPFVVLSGCGCGEIFCRGAYAFQFLELEFGVLFLVVGCLEEDFSHLLEAFLLGH